MKTVCALGTPKNSLMTVVFSKRTMLHLVISQGLHQYLDFMYFVYFLQLQYFLCIIYEKLKINKGLYHHHHHLNTLVALVCPLLL